METFFTSETRDITEKTTILSDNLGESLNKLELVEDSEFQSNLLDCLRKLESDFSNSNCGSCNFENEFNQLGMCLDCNKPVEKLLEVRFQGLRDIYK